MLHWGWPASKFTKNLDEGQINCILQPICYRQIKRPNLNKRNIICRHYFQLILILRNIIHVESTWIWSTYYKLFRLNSLYFTLSLLFSHNQATNFPLHHVNIVQSKHLLMHQTFMIKQDIKTRWAECNQLYLWRKV